MNENKKIMPERFCTLDNNMSLEKLIRARDAKETVVGKVVLWNSVSKHLDVDLGNGLYGILPIADASIYPSLLPNERIAPSIYATIGKPVIVTVKSVNTTGENPIIILSRKENMLNAFNTISESIGKDFECCVTSFASFGVFVEVANGVTGLIVYKDLCTSRIKSPTDIGINLGDKITAKLLSVDDNFRINLNYKDQFENLAYTLSTDNLIEATILEPINDLGYFCYLTPNTYAVVDVSPTISCKYGDKVIARVKPCRPNKPDKLRLSFVSFS